MKLRLLAVLISAGLLTAFAAAPGSSSASAPSLPPGCTGGGGTFPNATAVPVSGGVGAPPIVSTIDVSGAEPYLRDLDLITDISHTFSADLDLTLISPAGTEVTITTDNGGNSDNVFGNGLIGTRWDDDAATPVTTAALISGVPALALAPEEAMGAFVGEDPNGTWKLEIGDDAAPDNGQLNSWSLEMATIDGTPAIATKSVAGGAAGAIPNTGLIAPQAPVTGAGTYLADVELNTDISHLASGDLEIVLASPAGSSSQMSIRNGASFDNVFGTGAASTLWSDHAGDITTDPGGGPVTDAELANGIVETDLVPEAAMGEFTGENPNGSWSLQVTDAFAGGFGGNTGTLNSWSLTVTTISGCTAVPANNPPDADAGGPYEITEGDPLDLDASASSDPDPGDALTYSWDVNGDGVLGDASGETPSLTAAQLAALGIANGPASYQVRVQVSDGTAARTSAPTTLNVLDTPVPPPPPGGGAGGGGGGSGQLPTPGTQTTPTADASAACTDLRKRIRKAKSKKLKRKLRRQLRKRRC